MLKPITFPRARDRWLAALLAALLLLTATFALCRPIYETNDDSTIVAAASGAVTGAPYAGNGFTSYLYGAFLSMLFGLFPALPWHALMLLGMIALSLTALIQCFLAVGERCAAPAAVIWGILLALYVGVLMPYAALWQFTTVSALAASSGAVLLLCTGSQPGRAARFSRALATVLLLCGFGLRVQSLWVTMPLLAAYALLAWLTSPKANRQGALYCLLAVAALGLLTAADQALYRRFEPGWDAYSVFNAELSELLDYQNTDSINAVAREAAGWPEWTTYMVRSWYQLDERMTLESLSALTAALDAQSPAPTVASLMRAVGSVLLRFPMFSFSLAGFLALSLWAFWHFARERRWLGCLAVAVPYVYLAVFIAYFYGVLGRLPARAAFTAACPCYVLIALCCLWAFGPLHVQERSMARHAGVSAACIMLLLCVIPTVMHASERLPLRWQEQSRDAARALSDRMSAYAAGHADRIYVTDAPFDHDPFFVYGDALPVNLIEWCHGLFHSPMYQQKLRLLGFDGFTSRTLLREDMYLLLSGEGVLNTLRDYLSAEYGPVEADILFLGDGFYECRVRLVQPTAKAPGKIIQKCGFSIDSRGFI